MYDDVISKDLLFKELDIRFNKLRFKDNLTNTVFSIFSFLTRNISIFHSTLDHDQTKGLIGHADL